MRDYDVFICGVPPCHHISICGTDSVRCVGLFSAVGTAGALCALCCYMCFLLCLYAMIVVFRRVTKLQCACGIDVDFLKHIYALWLC